MPAKLTPEELVTLIILNDKGQSNPRLPTPSASPRAPSATTCRRARPIRPPTADTASPARPTPWPRSSTTGSAAAARPDEASPPRPVNVRALYDYLVAEHAYHGSYRSVLRFVRARYPAPRLRPFRRVETPPGAQAQVDWGEFAGLDVGEGPQTLYAFVMVLSHSRKEVVIWCRRMDQLAWHHAHNEAFRRLGGIPAVLRIDNLKTGHRRGGRAVGRGQHRPTGATPGASASTSTPACPAARRTRARSRTRSAASGGGSGSRGRSPAWPSCRADTTSSWPPGTSGGPARRPAGPSTTAVEMGERKTGSPALSVMGSVEEGRPGIEPARLACMEDLFASRSNPWRAPPGAAFVRPFSNSTPYRSPWKPPPRPLLPPLRLRRPQRVHSRYTRRLADLPCFGRAVRLQVTVRRFFCPQPECPRRIFAERLPGFAEPYARTTDRLRQAHESIGFALGGEAGSRLTIGLSMATSPDTLLRRVKQLKDDRRRLPRFVGIDDWAWCKGQRYGTIVVDLERGDVVDLLPDRDAETVKTWLNEHPGVELVSRDRWSAYAQAATEAAPKPQQVADRWHLLKNLREAIERLFERQSDGHRRGTQSATEAGVYRRPAEQRPPNRQWPKPARRLPAAEPNRLP